MGVVSFVVILYLATFPLLHARFFESQLEEAGSPRQKLDEFVVEVHVIADKAYHEYFDDEEALATYIAVMLNNVNLYYSDFSDPRVRFKLVGVTRKEEDDLPKTEQGAINGDKALRYMKKLYEPGKLPYRPDVILLLTSQKLVSVGRDHKTHPIGGIAVGLTCKKGVAISADTPGTYRGVYAAAHELAHTLKAAHCPETDGYVPKIPMCRKKEIHEYILTLNEYCLRETAKPLFEEEYPGDLPGEVINEEKYCEEILGAQAHGYTITALQTPDLSRKCKMKCCYQRDGRKLQCKKVNILDGMYCGEDKRCRAKQCARFKPE